MLRIPAAAAYDTAWKAFLADMGILDVEMSQSGPSRHTAVHQALIHPIPIRCSSVLNPSKKKAPNH
jgi:hypothetical protein